MIRIKIDGREFTLYAFSIDYENRTIEVTFDSEDVYFVGTKPLQLEFGNFNRLVRPHSVKTSFSFGSGTQTTFEAYYQHSQFS